MAITAACSHLVNAFVSVAVAAPPLAGQGAAPGAAPGADAARGAGGGGGGSPDTFIYITLIVIVMMVVFSIVAQRKEKKRRESLLGAIKKHDRVQTIGGVLGSVVEVKPDTVVLKVDEASNTRMTFAKSAVQKILREGPESESAR